MYARLRLDIGWRDLLVGAVALVTAGARDRRQHRVEELASPKGGVLCCLSVRSALDLYLRAVALPAGSEVLMTALNIPDMAKVVASHGLRPIPVDIDPHTLGPAPRALLRAASHRTRAVLVAHLFGCRVALGDVAALARERGWLLLEDSAQGYTGAEALGDGPADASFFSFGLIKTATALAGALVRVGDRQVLDRMRQAQARQPEQGRRDCARRLLVAVLLKLLLSWPRLLGGFISLWRKGGGDPERLLRDSARSFTGDELMKCIRQRPAAPVLALLERRLRQSPSAHVRARIQVAREILARLPAGLVAPGGQAAFHSYWVVPVLAPDPARLARALRDASFDAATTSSLRVLDAPPDRPDLSPVETRRMFESLVFLPVYPALSARARDHLIETLTIACDSAHRAAAAR